MQFIVTISVWYRLLLNFAEVSHCLAGTIWIAGNRGLYYEAEVSGRSLLVTFSEALQGDFLCT